MASVAATNPTQPSHGGGGIKACGGGIKVDALKHIDINQLSQSELQALSLSSNSAFDVGRTDDVVSPQVDRSVFNESAGSRRQTYSRLHHRSHSRFPGLHPSMKPHRQFCPSSDPVTHSIVHYFKHLLDGNHNPPPPPPPPPQLTQEVVAPVTELGFSGLQEGSKLKRKRVKKAKSLNRKKIFDKGVETGMQKVNKIGQVVDFAELEKNGDELYSGELKGRTVGMETEEAVLGFLSDLDGQWCSRRRRRKYVDAGLFGDALPVGWKLLLGLRRRDYRVSVYCRRYISPAGEHFISCREVASFLKSYFGDNEADQQRDQKTCSIQQAYVVSSAMNERPSEESDLKVFDKAAHSTVAIGSSNAHENENHLMGIENLLEVKARDSFECVKCNLTFEEKNVYLQHLFAYHQKTTKRYKIGTPVGEGVIIKDGKFECQFCHKVFDEKRSYSGHVGIHVRNSGKFSNELSAAVTSNKDPEPPLQEALPSSSSKMDALFEIAQSSTVETSNVGNSEHALTNQSANALNLEEPQLDCSNNEATLSSGRIVVQTEELKLSSDPIRVQTEDLKMSSDAIAVQTEGLKLSAEPIEVQTDDFNDEKSPSEQLNNVGHAMSENNDMVSNDYQWNININMDTNCLNDGVHVRAREIENYGNSNLEMDIGRNDHLEDTPGLNVGDIVFQDGVSTVPLTQSFDFFPSFDSASNKVEHEFSVVDQKLENVTGFEELRFDDIESFKYGYMNGQDLPSLPGCSMSLGNDGRIEEDGFNSSVRFHSQEVMLNTVDTSQLTVCVWCRTEFRLEGVELETPSDSIGYMCPTCKARISGHFGGGLSMDPRGF